MNKELKDIFMGISLHRVQGIIQWRHPALSYRARFCVKGQLLYISEKLYYVSLTIYSESLI